MLRLARNYRRCMSCHNLCQQVTNRSAAVRRMTSSTPRGQTDSSHIAIGVGLLAVSGALMYKSLKRTATDIFPEVKADKKPMEIPEASISSEEPVKDEEIVVSEEPEVVSAENSSEPEVVIKKVVQEESKKLPEAVPYVIVGGGTAAHAACRAIKKNDPNAKILVIGSEEILPYMRPPLSKELWFDQKSDVSTSLTYKAWNGKERSVFFEDNSYYTDVYDLNKEGGVAVLTGTKVVSVDAPGHSVTLESGEKVKYNKLLLATGGRPKQHPAFENLQEHTTLFRKVEDFQKLDSILKNAKNVLVVGGGFLGSELACALAAAGKEKNMQVTQAYNEDGNMAKVLPHYLSEWTTKKVNREGVKTLANHGIQSASFEDGKVNVVFKNGEKMSTDHVIVCVGLDANVELAHSSGLEVDDRHGGFRVNSELEARSDIWVAGDAASFYDINLGRRRVEHHDHAVVSGRLAGENMTGAKKAYHHQSMFWSDLGPEVGYEAIGLVDSSLPTVGVWAKATPQDTPKAASEATGETIRSEANINDVTSSPTPATTTPVEQQHSEEFGKGVVFYKQGKRVVGVLLWNIFGQMPVARKLISDAQEHEDMNKVAKLFKIHAS